jgi:hypothetical protein
LCFSPNAGEKRREREAFSPSHGPPHSPP